MFDDHDGAFLYHIRPENKPRHFLKPRMVVGRISEYEIELPVACLDESEHVSSYHAQGFIAELILYRRYEFRLHRCLFHSCHFRAPPREELETDGSGAREEIESRFPSRSSMFSSTLKRFSRAKSVVGRAVMLRGTSNRRLPYFPLIILILACCRLRGCWRIR